MVRGAGLSRGGGVFGLLGGWFRSDPFPGEFLGFRAGEFASPAQCDGPDQGTVVFFGGGLVPFGCAPG
jgi:hypothetical protein